MFSFTLHYYPEYPPHPTPPTPTPPGPKPFPQSPTPTQRGLCLDRGQMVYDCWPPHRQRGEGWPKTNANNYNFQCKWPSDMGWSWIISTLTFWVLASSYQPSFFRIEVKCCSVFQIHAKLGTPEFKHFGFGQTLFNHYLYLSEKKVLSWNVRSWASWDWLSVTT